MLGAGPRGRLRAELQASRCDKGLETLSCGHRHASVCEEVRVPADLWRLPAFSRHHHITGSLISSLFRHSLPSLPQNCSSCITVSVSNVKSFMDSCV